MRKFLLLVFISTLLGHPIFSQDTTSTLLDNVIITENRLQIPFSDVSRSIEVITRKQIENAPARNIPELLSYVSGIDIRQRGIGGVQADINIRGGTFDQTLILINGVALADPQTGHHILNIPLSSYDIERIEILKGAGARIFGQNAFAGVVNIVTKKMSENTEGYVGGSYEEMGTFQLKGGVSFADDILPTRLSFSHQRSDGYRKNTDFAITNFLMQNQIKLGKNKLDLIGSYNTREFGASGFYAGPAPTYASLPIDNNTEEFEKVTTTFASASMPIESNNFKITPRFSWRSSNDDYYFVRTAPIFNSTKSNVYTADVNSSYKSKYGTSGFGITFQATDLASKRLDTTTRRQFSAFLEHRFSLLNNRLDITPGFMFTSFSDFGSGFFPGVDVGFRASEKFKVYASYSSTFRIPTYTDLYFNNGANANNPLLQPEKANNLELGAKFNYNGLRITGAWFTRLGDSTIDRVKTNLAQKWFPTNLSKLSVEGVELSVDFLPEIWSTATSRTHAGLRGSDFWLKRINVSGTYITKVSYTTSETVVASRYAADNLRYQFNVNIEHAIVSKLSHSFNVRYFERFNLVKGYEEFYKGTIIDSRLAWTDSWGRVFLQANNLLSKKYVESNGITMPLRWMSLGLEFKL
jgi:vitamin B12 transporter